jgi:acetyl esterase/lipase
MKKYLAALGIAALTLLVVSTVSAGLFRDRYMDRAEARRGANNLEQDEGPSGPIALPEGVRAERDVAYGPDESQRLDVYFPKDPAAAPVLFMVHGGAWMVGDKASASVVVNKMKRWVPEGFIMVSVNYRLSPKADPVEQANDVAKALAFAQSRAKSWGGDPARFVVMGHSAGAHLVSLLAADPSIATHEGAKPWLGTISLDSAAYDVPRIMQARHFRFYDRVFKDDHDYWQKASPIYRISPAGAPMMLVCSSQRQDSCPQARSFAEKMSAKGRKVTVFPIASSHREINQNLGLPGGYTDAVESFLRSLGVNPK